MAENNTISELKNLVRGFRVTELSALLAFAGRDKHGRKNELRERALALCTRNTTPSIIFKIHELHRARLVDLGLPLPPAGSSSSSFDRTAEPPNKLAKHSNLPAPLSAANHGAFNTGTSHTPLVPVHPDVRFKKLPFYDFKCELLKPSSLLINVVVVRNLGRFQESVFTFFFTPQQAREIDRSRYIANELIEEFGLQVLIRFCLAETTCDQQDIFPSSICVRVNNKVIQLPTPILTNKPGVEPKRPGRPVDITHSCKLVSTEANRIDISWATDNIRNFCVGVTLESRLNSDILLHRLKTKGHKHADHTRALIKEKLAASGDAEIATTSLRCSLICPLGKMRMTLPIRSTQCNHLQCFDARTYIQMNEKKSTWLCPICDLPAEFKNLFIDGLFADILRCTSDTDDIEFTASGNWAPHNVKEEFCSKIDESVMIQNVDDDGEGLECAGPSHVLMEGEGSDCIDLTETDDEDDGTVQQSNPRSCNSTYSLSSDSTVVGSDYTSQTGTYTATQSQRTMLSLSSPDLRKSGSLTQQNCDDDSPPPFLAPYWGEATSAAAASDTFSSNNKKSNSQSAAGRAVPFAVSMASSPAGSFTNSPAAFSDNESSLDSSAPNTPGRNLGTPDVILLDSDD